jgi:hypothetical protein
VASFRVFVQSLHPAAEVCTFQNRTLAIGKETVATQMISSMKPQCLQVKSNMISKPTDFSATSFVTGTNQSMLSVTALNKQRECICNARFLQL